MIEAIAPPLLSVPLPVERLLRHHQINYQLREPRPGDRLIQTALLEDAIGPLFALFAADAILDLECIHGLTGRTLTVVDGERQQRMLERLGLEQLPPLPQFVKAPCLYDASVLAGETLMLGSGSHLSVIEISRAEYVRLLEDAQQVQIAEPMAHLTPNLDRPGEDHSAIMHAFTVRRVQQRLETVFSMPPLPETASRLMKMRVDPGATSADLAMLIEMDPPLAAQVMSWASSAFFAAAGKVVSVEDAITRVLGFERVLHLALGVLLTQSLESPGAAPIDSAAYWQKAFYTAVTAEALARCQPPGLRVQPGLAYLSGLLHNFGQLILAQVFPPHFNLVMRHLAANPQAPVRYVEEHLLGVSREQVAAWLLADWRMPEEVVHAIRFQWAPAYQGSHAAYAHLLYLSSQLLHRQGIGEGPEEPLPESLLQNLGLTRQHLDVVSRDFILPLLGI